ncbi:unnamed protein product [Caenorhabditis angaria]|uniref:Methyltransferase domain-containing protein n=1 Tax=Caenorhabditis angaria TaxID=860376 RepID=A0A9P1IGL5_9PELO|nr:unnamed protein product [Caenorhabditis angaria]
MIAADGEEAEGFYSYSSQDSRESSEDDLEKLKKQTTVNDFKKNKLEIEARRNWDKFYHRNKDNFFKDRNWSSEDLKIICPDLNFATSSIAYLEAGCGVGNMLFPLVSELPNLKLFAFDFSANAVKLLEKRAEELNLEVETSVIDLSLENVDARHFCAFVRHRVCTSQYSIPTANRGPKKYVEKIDKNTVPHSKAHIQI